MTRRVYLDLDGTVINIFFRYCGVLNEYLSRYSKKSVGLDIYKIAKRAGMSESEIAFKYANTIIDVEHFKAYRRKRLEDLDWLNTDILILNVELAKQMIREFDLRMELLTLRRNKENCIVQLKWLNIFDIFSEIHILSPNESENPKFDYIKAINSKGNFIIGDSPLDMACSKQNGCTGLFVDSGLFEKPQFYDGIIYRDVNDALKVISSNIRKP